MNPNWHPDPRWPRHILELATRITEGTDCYDQLHDALLDEGLSKMSESMGARLLGLHVATPFWTKGLIVGLIVGDGWHAAENLEEEKDAYLDARGPKP